MSTIELPEGSGMAKLAHVIKALGYNKDVDFEFGTVTSGGVKLDNETFELDAEDFDIAEHLTAHTRTAMITGNGLPYTVSIAFESALTIGSRVIVASYNAGQRYIILDRVGGAADGA
ncbi:DUF2577 family protein [Paenibacillus humicus]|uniref:DUF2577 family protein n=1 Tax=Paenibacillus humicus TaxID=412861 RepID=UPI000FD86F2E|nr:DUF2577 family protein [Paenibacillus humicus]